MPPLRLSPAPPVVPPVVPLRARRPRPAVLASPALLALMAACGGAPTAVDPGPAEAPDSPPRSAPIGASPDGETPAGDTPAGDIPASGTPVSDAPESGSPASAPPTDPDAALAAQLTSCGADLPCAEAALRALPPPPGLSPRVDPLPALDARRAAAVAAADPALRASPAGVVTLEAAAAEGFAWGLYVGRGAAPAVAARVTGPHAPLLRTAFAVEAARLLAQGRPPERAPAAIVDIHAGRRPAPRGQPGPPVGCAAPPPPAGAPATPLPGGGARLLAADPQVDLRIAALEAAAWAGAGARDLAPGLADPAAEVTATAARLITALPQDPDHDSLLAQIAAHPHPVAAAWAADRPAARRCPG